MIEALREKLEFAESNPQLFEPIKVLDKGEVLLIDWVGSDARIAQAARVSYGQGTKSVRDNAGLIDYLMRHKHTSPFEMVDFTFRIKLPLFVFAQLVRHRTSSLNAMSGRYSVMKDEFYIPDELRGQDTNNKQGSSGVIEDPNNDSFIDAVSTEAYADYEYLLGLGVAREQARMVLPQNLYTEIYWKQNLHNLLHLLRLRMDGHAQWEIRQYANAIYSLIRPIVPAAIESWERHVLDSVTLSSIEIDILRNQTSQGIDAQIEELTNEGLMSKGYAREVRERLVKLLNG